MGLRSTVWCSDQHRGVQVPEIILVQFIQYDCIALLKDVTAIMTLP